LPTIRYGKLVTCICVCSSRFWQREYNDTFKQNLDVSNAWWCIDNWRFSSLKIYMSLGIFMFFLLKDTLVKQTVWRQLWLSFLNFIWNYSCTFSLCLSIYVYIDLNAIRHFCRKYDIQKRLWNSQKIWAWIGLMGMYLSVLKWNCWSMKWNGRRKLCFYASYNYVPSNKLHKYLCRRPATFLRTFVYKYVHI
jgi:hypothetical protein